jgi:hypothetical protein
MLLERRAWGTVSARLPNAPFRILYGKIHEYGGTLQYEPYEGLTDKIHYEKNHVTISYQ